MADDWASQFVTLARNLLSLEINTVVKEGLSAQKMPEVPLALHTLVQTYQDYLFDKCKLTITQGLLTAAAFRVGGIGASAPGMAPAGLLRLLENWNFSDGTKNLLRTDLNADISVTRTLPLEDEGKWQRWFADVDPAPDHLTNGAESFEALQWAAKAALERDWSAAGAKAPDRAVLNRIRANCRQLREAALLLESQLSSPGGMGTATVMDRFQIGARTQPKQDSKLAVKERLAMVANPGTPNEPPDKSRLFGGSVEQTVRALLQHPRPSMDIDTDLVVLIRKAWDVGTERVCLQTVLQIDGDVMQQIGDMRDDERDFLVSMHRDAVALGVSQWKNLFGLLRDLIGDVGRNIFGRTAG